MHGSVYLISVDLPPTQQRTVIRLCRLHAVSLLCKASEWSNVLLLVEPCFLPSSNGNLERLFSTFNVIKGTRSLSNNTVKDLVCKVSMQIEA